MTEAEGWTATNAAEVPCINFMDHLGRSFILPADKCDSAEEVGKLIARHIGLDENEIDFWVNDRWILPLTWRTEVKPGSFVTIRRSPVSHSLSSIPPPPSRPPTPASTASTACPPLSPSTAPLPCLDPSKILEVQGHYVLPFFNAEGRVYRIVHDSTDWDPRSKFQKLRDVAPAERWGNIRGDLIPRGRVSTLDTPRILIPPCLTRHDARKRRVRYILIREGDLEEVATRGNGCFHLGGDVAYQWVLCPSFEHAKEELFKTMKKGCSIVGGWDEPIDNLWQRVMNRIKVGLFKKVPTPKSPQVTKELCEILSGVVNDGQSTIDPMLRKSLSEYMAEGKGQFDYLMFRDYEWAVLHLAIDSRASRDLKRTWKKHWERDNYNPTIMSLLRKIWDSSPNCGCESLDSTMPSPCAGGHTRILPAH